MAEYPTIDSKVEIIDYGPKLVDPETGKVIMTPDEMVALSSGWIYKNTGAFENLQALKKEEKDLHSTAKKTLIGAAGRGHASLSTSIGMWLNIQNSSKMVDSYFTGATFVSALMPSGRRTGINLEQIVIPKDVIRAGQRAQQEYIRTSEFNIKTYQELLDVGIKQDAAGKIVQYGIAGGGFLFMPLETFVGFERDVERNEPWIPSEIPQILKEIKEQFPKLGMNMTYAARKGAARLPYPIPTIFKPEEDGSAIAREIKTNCDMQSEPKIMGIKNIYSAEREYAINDYLGYLNWMLSSPDTIKTRWNDALQIGGELIKAFNSTEEVKIGSAIPWRVWGEVKRHRTMQQNPESIYSALERAKEEFNLLREDFRDTSIEGKLKRFERCISIPPAIKENPELLNKWLTAFYRSFDSYDSLVDMGVRKPDAIHVIPRGLKLGNEKTLDIYNLTHGYLSLRLCGTAEEEMKRLSEKEFDLIQKSPEIGEDIKALIRPKCGYVGFCLEPWAKCKGCLKIQKYVPFEYTEQVHAEFDNVRKEVIESILASE